MSLVFKWHRLIFVLISLEYLVMSLFLDYSFFLSPVIYFYFMSFTVISRVLGIVIMVGTLKLYGQDKRIFYEFKLIETISFQN